jgi:hypothetical protein
MDMIGCDMRKNKDYCDFCVYFCEDNHSEQLVFSFTKVQHSFRRLCVIAGPIRWLALANKSTDIIENNVLRECWFMSFRKLLILDY